MERGAIEGHQPDTDALKARIRELEQALEAAGGSRSSLAAIPANAFECVQRFSELLSRPEALSEGLVELARSLGVRHLALYECVGGNWQAVAQPSMAPPLEQLPQAGADHPTRLTLEASSTAWTLAIAGDTNPTLLAAAAGQPLPQRTALLHTLAQLAWDSRHRERRLTELTERDRRFRYAMQASRDGLWDWDIQTGQVYFARGYLRMLGYGMDELPARIETLRDYFLHPEDADAVMTELKAAVDNRRDHLRLEHRLLHRGGHSVWVHARCLFVEPDADGHPTRCVGTNSDITDELANKEALVTAKAEADAANRAKSQFLASMSHEIRTPMNAIIGLGHLLEDTPLEPTQRGYLEGMESAAQSLLQTVDQVFDYAKLETGKIILENNHFDLEQLFERLSRMLETSARHRPANLIFDIADDVPRFLRGDPTRLSHIISHLVTNALQYSQSDRIIVRAHRVATHSDHYTLRFSITDFGRGLEEAELARVRRELARPALGGIEGEKPRGFGLQICKLLVGLMNGTLNITSRPHQSTTLTFTADLEKSHIGTHRIESERAHCRWLRLLVIDDNELALEILAKSAGKLIDHVDTAGDAHTAFGKLRRAEADGKPYDLLLLDYKMPLVSGIEAARQIKTADDIHHKPRIFLVSSFHRDEIFTERDDNGYVDDFLSKPVSDSRLFDAISRAMPECLDDPSAEQDNFDQLAGTQVLLVEDNVINRKVAAGIMRKKQVEVTCAGNGREALDILAQTQTPFDVVLMDVEMPEMDGLTATRCIRENPDWQALPVVAVTAQAMSGDREACLEAGMNEYISKPIKPAALYQILADQMRGQSTTTAPRDA